MQNYEPPVLACAVNEVLGQITGEESSLLPTILVPFIVASSKLKKDGKSLTKSENRVSVYGVHIGPETDITKAVAARTGKLSCSFQVHHEPLACLLQLIRVLQLPTSILIGERGRRVSDENIEDLEVLVLLSFFAIAIAVFCVWPQNMEHIRLITICYGFNLFFLYELTYFIPPLLLLGSASL